MFTLSKVKKTLRQCLISIRNFDPQQVNLWCGESLVKFELDRDKSIVHFSANQVKSEFLIQSPQFSLTPGVYDISLIGEINDGNCMFGVLDVKRNLWVATQPIFDLGGRAHVEMPIIKKEYLQLVISANNINSSGSISGTLSQVLITKTGDISSASSMIENQAEQAERVRWRQEEQPKQLLEQLDADIEAVKLANINNQYAVIKAAKIGYAARSAISVTLRDRFFVLVANAGDDTVTLLEREQVGGLLKWQCDLQFPEFSTPVDLQNISGDDDILIGISFFHMQKVTSAFGDTSYGTVSLNWILERSKSKQKINVEKSDIRILHSRTGFWGARNSTIVYGGNLGRWLAVTDRDASSVWLFYQSPDDKDWQLPPQVLPLEAGFEPVGISGLIRGQKAIFYVAARLLPKVAAIEATPLGEAKIISEVDTGGLSRSSISIGRFDESSALSLAIGLWGGDPTDVTTPHTGSIFCADILDDGELTNFNWFDAGTNTTDVVAGDFDNDGFDELVVLNYGNGLNLEERSDLGNLQVFKKFLGNFKCISTIDLPTPRIGLVADFDGDGRDELGVTLFHEKRLAIIKHID